jgi:hypothetical protein
VSASAPLCKCGKRAVFVRHQDAEDVTDVTDEDLAVSDVRWVRFECDVYQCECGLWQIVDTTPPPSKEVRALLAEFGIEAKR